MMNLSLFQIAQQHRQLVDKLADLDLDEQTLADTLEAESWPIEQKCENTMFVVRAAQLQQEAIDAEIERLSMLRERIAGRESSLRRLLETGMQIAGITKITAGTFSLALQKNPPSVEILDEKQLPAKFMRTPEPKPVVPAPDKKLIAAALKAGEPVPGAKLAPEKLRLVIR